MRRSGQSNAEGMKIPIKTKLNIRYFHEMCKNTVHKKHIKYLKYGWPLGHNGKTIPNEPKRNHKGVTEFQTETHEYIQKEVSKKQSSWSL